MREIHLQDQLTVQARQSALSVLIDDKPNLTAARLSHLLNSTAKALEGIDDVSTEL
jgi:hypothetical protein